MKLLKRIIFVTFLIILFSIAISTIFPRELGQNYVYNALWFELLWFILSIGIIVSMVNYYRRGEYGLGIVYLGFLFILIGGFLTTSLGKEGFIEIRENENADGYWIEDDLFEPLGFSLALIDFSVEMYPSEMKGMRVVKSYKSLVNIRKEGRLLKEAVIEVNRPLNFGGFSFYQYAHDASFPDQTIMQAVKDPGLAVVYSGYMFLLAGLALSCRRIWRI